MVGWAWYISAKCYDITIVRKWCENNLTKKSWYISERMFGVYDVCIGVEEDAIAFKLRWL